MYHTSLLDEVFNQARHDFLKSGYGRIPEAIPKPLLSALRNEADGLIRLHGNSEHDSPDYWTFTSSATGQPVLYRIHNLERQSGALHAAQLFAAGPMHALATQVLNGPVSANACAMIVKMPLHAAAVPWHRDRTDVPAGSACNLSLFLDDCDAGNGCLQFVPGSHRLYDGADVQNAVNESPIADLPLRAGEIAVHDVRAVHGSLPNSSRRIRRSIVIEFSRTDLDRP